MSTKTPCAICAWRENCNKRFSMSGSTMHCADFAKDISIKDPALAKEAPVPEK